VTYFADIIYLLNGIKEDTASIAGLLYSSNALLSTIDARVASIKTDTDQLVPLSEAIQIGIDNLNSGVSDTNSLITHSNDLLQTYIGDVEGAASTVSLQDILNDIVEQLHDSGTGDPYLLSIESKCDIIAGKLTAWNLSDTCKVTVDNTVTVEGSVSVEPGVVPLDVVVLP